MGASDRAGTGRTALGALNGGAIGRDWCTAEPAQEGGAVADDDAME